MSDLTRRHVGKHPLQKTADEQNLVVGMPARVVHVAWYLGFPTVWIEQTHDLAVPDVVLPPVVPQNHSIVTFVAIPDGAPYPDGFAHVGTCIDSHGFVVQVYARGITR